MDKFNEGRYSEEDALDEAAKITQKVGKGNAPSYAYDEAEKLVEAEKRSAVEVPISAEAEEAADESYRKASEIDKEIKRRAEPLIHEIYARLSRELGKEEAWENWKKVRFENDMKSRGAIDKWVKEIYEGKYGSVSSKAPAEHF